MNTQQFSNGTTAGMTPDSQQIDHQRRAATTVSYTALLLQNTLDFIAGPHPSGGYLTKKQRDFIHYRPELWSDKVRFEPTPDQWSRTSGLIFIRVFDRTAPPAIVEERAPTMQELQLELQSIKHRMQLANK